MAMIIGKVYPDGETYYGDAIVEHITFKGPGTGIFSDEEIAQTMVTTAEHAISLKNGVMLESYVWVNPIKISGIPCKEFIIDIYYFKPATLALVTVSASVLLLAALAVMGLWFVGHYSERIIHGRPPIIDPETGLPVKDPNVSLAEVANKAMTYAGPLLLGYGALMLYQTYQKTKVGGYNGIP